MDKVEVDEFKFIILQKGYNQNFRGIFIFLGIIYAIVLLMVVLGADYFYPVTQSQNMPDLNGEIEVRVPSVYILVGYLSTIIIVSCWFVIKCIFMLKKNRKHEIKVNHDMKIIFSKDMFSYQRGSEFILKYSYKNILKYNFDDYRRELTILIGDVFYKFNLSYISKEEREFIRKQLKQCDRQIEKIEKNRKFYGKVL